MKKDFLTSEPGFTIAPNDDSKMNICNKIEERGGSVVECWT